MKIIFFSAATNIVEDGKWMIAVTFFEILNSVFTTTDEHKTFSISIRAYWNSKSTEKTIDELYKILELRSQNDIVLHVEQVRKSGNSNK